ncbi:MAG TPA: hypothetical protein ENI87_04165, partial [bacterium]|nr:hypothetical protein [bacterium]
MNRRLVLLLVVLLATALALPGQEKLHVEQPVPAVLRLGDTARVILTIEGNTANPRDPELPVVPGLQMTLRGPGYSRQTHFDGRNLVERVSVQYAIELRAERPGVFEIPSFAIWTGTKEQRTPVLKLEVRQDMAGAELGWLEVHIEKQRVYVHEPVRVRVDFAVLEGLRLALDVHNRTRYLDLEVQAPWLDGFQGGERIDVSPVSGDSRTCICNRTLVTAAFDASFERDGKRFQKFSIERAFLPTRLGRIELPAPLLRFNVVRGATRPDLFGRRRNRTENFFVYGEPVAIDVLPIPEEGRPTPFYGAVGRFEIAASVDRQQVKVGDSIKLTLVVSGSGNIEFLRLPELEQLDGFHKLGAAEAVRGDGKVAVTYDLTPLSAEVREIPSIAWNFFD